MGLFNKLKEILFDEETVEIPVITKEETTSKPVKKVEKNDEEVIVRQIEHDKDDDLFDMPKLKEEAREEVRTNTFTFPVFDDEDLDIKQTSRTAKNKTEEKRETRPKNDFHKYEYLSSTDYRSKNDTTGRSNSRYTSQETSKETKKPFTLSPIISPVYGILNENYKKEDIITKSEASHRLTSEKVDLDSVRRKAYGSLEDELEISLGKKEDKADILDEIPSSEEVGLEGLSDDGISISDLLVDDQDSENETLEKDIQTDEIELDDEVVSENDDKNNEALGEEDLFDLIDSLYAGKEEN